MVINAVDGKGRGIMNGKLRGISVWGVVVVLALLLLPSLALAADKPTVTLEQAIKIVKDNFEVAGDAADFRSGFESYEGRQSWSLSWNNPNGLGSSMNAEVDAVTGDILNMNFWKYVQPGTQAASDPKSVVSREDALATAEEIIKRLEPDKIGDLQLVQNTGMLITGSGDFENYNFHWQRLVGGISFPQDGITITVGSRDKRVINYRFHWARADFPKSDGVIPTAQAEQTFRSVGMMKLQYAAVSDKSLQPMQKMRTKPKVILVYRLQDPSGGIIDAFTGKPVNLQEGGGWPRLFMDGDGVIAGNQAEKLSSIGMSQLSPEELQETQETAKLITREQAIEDVKKWVNIPEILALNSANLSIDWRNPDNRVWNLKWSDSSNGEKLAVGELQYVFARIDAVTGELLGFGLDHKQNSQQADATMDRKAAQKLAEDFLRKVQPQRFAEARLNENSSLIPVFDKVAKNPPYQNFNYLRVVNGITFPDNLINVNVDTVNGIITSYELTWSHLEFPRTSQAIPVARGEDAFLSYQPLNLTYVQTQTQKGPGEIRLVYLPLAPAGTSFTDTISAVTGEPLDWQGKPISDLPKAYRFTDIQNSFAAREISLLGQRGIFGEYVDTFHPDEKVTTVSLLRAMRLASGTREYANLSDKEILDQAEKQGWLVKGEQWQFDGTVSRENMAKLLVRFMDLDRVARLKGIYQVPFNDAADISPDSLGYVALARGLEIIKGDGSDFRPTDPVTRAQAAVMLVRAIEAK